MANLVIQATATQRGRLLRVARCAAPGSIGGRTLASAAAARIIRLQQMRQRVYETQLTVFHAEEMSIWRSAAAPAGRASTECAEGHYGSDRLVDDEVPVRDVYAARYANLARIIRSPLANMHPPSDRLQGKPQGTKSTFPSRNPSR